MSDDEREYRITIGDVERIADRQVLDGGVKILIALYFSGAVITFLRSFLDIWWHNYAPYSFEWVHIISIPWAMLLSAIIGLMWPLWVLPLLLRYLILSPELRM